MKVEMSMEIESMTLGASGIYVTAVEFGFDRGTTCKCTFLMVGRTADKLRLGQMVTVTVDDKVST